MSPQGIIVSSEFYTTEIMFVSLTGHTNEVFYCIDRRLAKEREKRKLRRMVLQSKREMNQPGKKDTITPFEVHQYVMNLLVSVTALNCIYML